MRFHHAHAPLVKVFQYALKTGQDTFGNAGDDLSIVVVLGRVGNGAQGLNDGDEKGSKANRSKACRHRAAKQARRGGWAFAMVLEARGNSAASDIINQCAIYVPCEAAADGCPAKARLIRREPPRA